MSGSEPTTPSPGRALLGLPRAPTVPAPHRLCTRSSPSDLTPPALCSGNPPHIPSSGQGKGELGANPPLVFFTTNLLCDPGNVGKLNSVWPLVSSSRKWAQSLVCYIQGTQRSRKANVNALAPCRGAPGGSAQRRTQHLACPTA